MTSQLTFKVTVLPSPSDACGVMGSIVLVNSTTNAASKDFTFRAKPTDDDIYLSIFSGLWADHIFSGSVARTIRQPRPSDVVAVLRALAVKGIAGFAQQQKKCLRRGTNFGGIEMCVPVDFLPDSTLPAYFQ